MVKLVLLLTLMIIGNTRACPNMCKCHNLPLDNHEKSFLYYTSVSCNAFATNITRFLSNTTRNLRLSFFNDDEVETVFGDLEDNLTNLPQLVHLEIINSDLGNFSYDNSNWIRFLSLADNHFRVIPRHFSNLTNLKTFDLSHNEIRNIDDRSFDNMEVLEQLNLSANSIKTLNENSFIGLKYLKSLDLSRNELKKIGNQVFTPLTNLQYLNLSSNKLETLNEICLGSLLMMQHLDISWNKLVKIAPGSLHLPNLARLLLAGNPLLGNTREASILVGTGRKLQIVDASRTGLKQVPAALTHSIRTLRVAGNSIRVVNCGDLDSYPLIQLLDFASNELEFIEEDALGRLDSLSVLYLSDNHIPEIPKSLPEKLSVLHLEYNDIEKVSDKDLLGLTALEVLLLNDNKIRVVDEGAFGQLVSLVTLDLSRNPIVILQPGCLSGPSAIQVLRLASIGIISPAEEVSFPLSSPEHLITLDLSDSPGLARQLLVDTAALAASKELQELDLTHTDLEYIRSDLLHYLPQLRVLHIKDNRLNCSQLQWLASWMRRQNELEYRDVVCATPPDLWGTPLVDLQDPETTPIHAINQEIEVDIRETINLEQQNITQDIPMFTSVHPSENPENTTEKDDIDNNFISKTVVAYKPNMVIIKKKVINTEKKKKIIKLISNTNILPATLNDLVITTSANKEEGDGISSLPSSTDLNMSGNTINHASDVAITKMPSALKQTVAESDWNKLTPQNANETVKSESNKQDQHTLISEISRNLFIAPADGNFNNTVHEKVKLKEDLSIDVVESAPQWNASTGEMSMFTNNKQGGGNFLLHPGMLILAIGILGAAAALAMLAAKFTKKRRNSNIFRQENIEVNSLPSVTELW